MGARGYAGDVLTSSRLFVWHVKVVVMCWSGMLWDRIGARLCVDLWCGQIWSRHINVVVVMVRYVWERCSCQVA